MQAKTEAEASGIGKGNSCMFSTNHVSSINFALLLKKGRFNVYILTDRHLGWSCLRACRLPHISFQHDFKSCPRDKQALSADSTFQNKFKRDASCPGFAAGQTNER